MTVSHWWESEPKVGNLARIFVHNCMVGSRSRTLKTNWKIRTIGVQLKMVIIIPMGKCNSNKWVAIKMHIIHAIILQIHRLTAHWSKKMKMKLQFHRNWHHIKMSIHPLECLVTRLCIVNRSNIAVYPETVQWMECPNQVCCKIIMVMNLI